MITKAKKSANIEPPVENLDPVEAFIRAATAPLKKLRLNELDGKREAALEELANRHGEIEEADGGKIVREMTLETAKNIADPIHRFIALSEVARRSWHHNKAMDAVRRDRRTAIQILRYRCGWKPSAIKKLIGAKDRRVVDFANAVGDVRLAPSMTEEQAKAKAIKSHRKYVRMEAEGKLARPFRDELITALTRGEAGRLQPNQPGTVAEPGESAYKWPNGELSRLGKMTSAAIAQIRNGTAPSAKRAAREDNAA